MTSVEALGEIRALHSPITSPIAEGEWCDTCTLRWPCETWRIAQDALAEAAQ